MKLTVPPRNRSLGSIDALGLVGLIGFLVARFVPLSRLPFWGCTFREMTNIPCPGCGLTRVAHRMVHLDVFGAFTANPLGAIAALFFAVCIVASAIHLVFGVPLPEIQLTDREWRRVRWAGVGLLALNYAFVIFAWRVLGLS